MAFEFWDWFDKYAAPNLGIREPTFRHMFKYLDTVFCPTIVETGCMRQDGWSDGRSTELFATYALITGGVRVHSFELLAENIAYAEKYTKRQVEFHAGDSVDNLALFDRPIDLLYLDSLDVDMNDPDPSALHHQRELLVSLHNLRSQSLVVCDDSPEFSGRVWGKGKFIAGLAKIAQAELQFHEYQVGWTQLVSSEKNIGTRTTEDGLRSVG